jgi:ribonuclease BN (tRNA processing enzyme)
MTPSTIFITLGTAGGPMQNPERAQPSHVVMYDDTPILVDCGEGAMRQLKRAGIEFRNVRDIFLSHHHFDHIGSLFACFGLNMMIQRRETLTIYGPPGTQQIVDGLIAACNVPNEIGFGVAGQRLPHPRDFVEVCEIVPDDVIEIGELKVTCCENTHYRAEGKLGEEGYLSLSLRFDAPDRSILYTGDTGPSETVETFAKGVDLFVGEMMDVDKTMEKVREMNPQMPDERIQQIGEHLSQHHLSPEQLAEMAARAGADHVVAVHFAPGLLSPETIPTYTKRVQSTFSGEVSLGVDLASY